MKSGLFRTASRIAIGLAAAATVSSFASSEASHTLCEGFVPPNDMNIPVGSVQHWSFNGLVGGMTQDQFNAVIDRFERLYSDDIAKAGGTLKVNRLWDDGTVNASAQQLGTDWIINMYGGLARHPAITFEGLALVICHENGHHLGGAPKKMGRWATNEGGADYFATLKCLRRFFAEDDNETIISQSQIDPLAKQRCEEQFTNRKDQLLCMRGTLAGNSVALLFMDLRHEQTPPGFGTPDSSVVSTMYDGHPATQCRMDTYFNGASCKVDVSVPLSNMDYHEGSCSQPNDTIGFRPLCWFKP